MQAIAFSRPCTSTQLWGRLSAPVDPAHDLIIMRAQSYLSGSLLASERAPGGACPPLTLAQACDVLAWAGLTV